MLFLKLDDEFLKAISSWYLGAELAAHLKVFVFASNYFKKSSRYGQGCTCVGWSSWLPTSLLVLGGTFRLRSFESLPRTSSHLASAAYVCCSVIAEV